MGPPDLFLDFSDFRLTSVMESLEIEDLFSVDFVSREGIAYLRGLKKVIRSR